MPIARRWQRRHCRRLPMLRQSALYSMSIQSAIDTCTPVCISSRDVIPTTSKRRHYWLHHTDAMFVRWVLFCSVLSPSSIRGLATPWTYFLHLSLSSAILTDSSRGSPVHVLMLSIQAVRGLPRLRAPGIVPCIISRDQPNSRFHGRDIFSKIGLLPWKRLISVKSVIFLWILTLLLSFMKVSEFYQQHLCGFCCLLCVTLEHFTVLSLD